MTTDTPAKCYSIRRPCPFRGTLQIIELEDSRALTSDGVNWELQVAAEQPDTLWGCINTDNSQQQFFRFGVWSVSEGLARVPVNPIMDIKAMLESSGRLLSTLQNLHEQIPFPLVDTFEYWLLDEHMKPLALIESSCSTNQLDYSSLPIWKATLLQEQEFCCHQHMDPRTYQTPASMLESDIQQRAGSARPSQWFRRKDNGDGVGLDGRINGKYVARRVPAADFPELLIQTDWTESEHRSLAKDYLQWMAPLLLTLQHISFETRDRLEHEAAQRPELVEKLWRVYPEIINESLLKKIRVEARIRKSG